MAAADVRDKLIALAAEHLDVQPGMLTCANGRVFVTETPERGYTLGQLARMSLTSASGPIMGTASLSAMPFAPSSARRQRKSPWTKRRVRCA